MFLQELDKQLGELIMNNQKINKSLLAEKYGISRGTVIRHLQSLDLNVTKTRKRRECELLKYDSTISEMLSDPQNSIKAVYMYLLNCSSRLAIGSYSNFKQYVEKHYNEIRINARRENSKYRFETPMGLQLQFDWIEDLKLHLKDSTLIVFNLWSATLGFSRYHFYRITLTITESDFRRCLIDTIIAFGGKPKEVLTDNMSAIVKVVGNKKHIHPTVVQFLKDIGIKLNLCKVRHAYTKGKVEVSNKYQSWLTPYDYKFNTFEDLAKGIEQVLSQANFQPNDTTKIAPYILFKKEKERLEKLPPMSLLKQYHSQLTTKDVNVSNLIKYDGAFYGVPYQYSNKKVLICEENDNIFIYDTSLKLLGIYKKYSNGIHYARGLYAIAKRHNETEQEFNARIDDNLLQLANVGGKNNAN